MQDRRNHHCPDCADNVSRRDFVKKIGGAALAVGAVPLLGTSRRVQAAPTSKGTAETTVKRLYDSLSESQKKVICFDFDDNRRKRINANWAITKPKIDGDFYTDEQRKLNQEIFRGLTSEDGFERFMKQTEDDLGGFGNYHVAIFGKPGEKFEWELTGRHLTIRADGNSVDNAAFGGPIVYGHGESNPKANLFHYQTKKANEVFQALDPKHREQALLDKAPVESQVPIKGERGKFFGVSVGEFSSDQLELLEQTVKAMLAPYREEDVQEALSVLKAGGGLKKLHMAFYRNRANGSNADLGNDKVWDIFRVEGPTFVWHFRGAPHVHTYINIGSKA